MRILFILPDFDAGGGQIAALRLANELAKRHEVKMVNARSEVNIDRISHLINASVDVLSLLSKNFEKKVEYLSNYVRLNRVDLIHSHVWWADKLALSVAKITNVTWVSTLHGCQEFLSINYSVDNEYNGFVSEFYRYICGVAYVSDKNLLVASKRYLSRTTVFEKIYNGINLNTADIQDLSDNNNVKKPLSIILVSRAIYEKGWETAIKACEMIENDYGPGAVRLCLVGDGPDRERLENAYKSKDWVEFFGHHDNPKDLIIKADVGLLPTTFVSESLPNSVAEYMASGVPTIATAVGEVSNMLVGGRHAGLTLDLANQREMIEQLYYRILQYIEDPKLRNEHGRNGFWRVKSMLEISQCAAQYEKFYEKAISVSRINVDNNEREVLDFEVFSFDKKENFLKPMHVRFLDDEYLLYDNRGISFACVESPMTLHVEKTSKFARINFDGMSEIVSIVIGPIKNDELYSIAGMDMEILTMKSIGLECAVQILEDDIMDISEKNFSEGIEDMEWTYIPPMKSYKFEVNIENRGFLYFNLMVRCPRGWSEARSILDVKSVYLKRQVIT
jgi:glycosyltransferase involved in cell wall biosynthesis